MMSATNIEWQLRGSWRDGLDRMVEFVLLTLRGRMLRKGAELQMLGQDNDGCLGVRTLDFKRADVETRRRAPDVGIR
jgi:hypothetical protein